MVDCQSTILLNFNWKQKTNDTKRTRSKPIPNTGQTTSTWPVPKTWHSLRFCYSVHKLHDTCIKHEFPSFSVYKRYSKLFNLEHAREIQDGSTIRSGGSAVDLKTVFHYIPRESKIQHIGFWGNGGYFDALEDSMPERNISPDPAG